MDVRLNMFEEGEDLLTASDFSANSMFLFFFSLQIAELFRDALRKEFHNCFKLVSFAIIDDQNTRKAHNPQGNLIPFANVFHSEVLDLDQVLGPSALPQEVPPAEAENKEKEDEDTQEEGRVPPPETDTPAAQVEERGD
jgi:hypothetical protein